MLNFVPYKQRIYLFLKLVMEHMEKIITYLFVQKDNFSTLWRAETEQTVLQTTNPTQGRLECWKSENQK